MKRIFSLLLILSLIAWPALAETPADPLLEQALALARRLGELAASEDYVAAYSTSSAVSEVIAVWAEGDYDAPAAVGRLTLDPDATATLIAALSGGAQLSGLPETVYEEISQRMLSALPSMLIGTAGVENIAAASIMTIRTAFVCETCDTPALYILGYEHGTSVAVTFQPCQDGAVLAQACFIDSPARNSSDDDYFNVLAVLNVLGVIEFEEVPLP